MVVKISKLSHLPGSRRAGGANAVIKLSRSSTGGRRPLGNTGLAGGRTLPLLDCSGGHVYGGRPKAAIYHAVLRRAGEGRSGTLVLLDSSGGHVYGGRPKAAIDHAALRWAAEGRPFLKFVDPCACA